jgi:hypothetical protein
MLAGRPGSKNRQTLIWLDPPWWPIVIGKGCFRRCKNDFEAKSVQFSAVWCSSVLIGAISDGGICTKLQS